MNLGLDDFRRTFLRQTSLHKEVRLFNKHSSKRLRQLAKVETLLERGGLQCNLRDYDDKQRELMRLRNVFQRFLRRSRSSSSGFFGITFDKTSWPVLVTSRSSSMRMPMSWNSRLTPLLALGK